MGRCRCVASLLALTLALSACANDPDPTPLDPSAPAQDDNGKHRDDETAAELDLTPGSEVTIEGVVTANSVDPCRLPDEHDEPCIEDLGEILTVDVEGTQVAVHYGGGEWPPCDNPDALYQGEATRVGDRVTVVAEVVDGDHHASADLDTCGSREFRIDVHD